VDFIIALTHVGYDVDNQIAAAVSGLGMIVGGHSHTPLLTAEKIKDTYITQAGEWSKYVGRENLIFYKGKLVDVISMPIAYSADIAKSPRTGKLAETVAAQIEEEMGSVIGQTSVLLDGARENVRSKETNLGDLIADVMRESTGADVAVTNGGGIRASLEVGEITANDVHTVLPFGNTLCTIDLTGAQLKAALEHSVRLYPATNGGFLQVSGLTMSFDPSQPEGQRVVDVQVNGMALDPEAVYTVATNDFTAAGGDGYVSFSEGTNLVDTGLALDIVLMEYIQQQGTISGQTDGRITVIGG
jgi:2',3'-cyclic-nucleotide 2'-phosphodiesterase (5'-nucleotidase family)